MSSRTSKSTLDYLVNEINRITNSPAEAYSKSADGKYHANIGNYHLDYAYSGVQLNRMVNDGGGVSTPLGMGFYTKHEMEIKLRAFIAGLTYEKEA